MKCLRVQMFLRFNRPVIVVRLEYGHGDLLC